MLREQLIVDRHNAILTIQLNRPEKKNALTEEMYRGMIAALEQADGDERIRCIYLTGSADCFCAGNDLKDFLDSGPQPAAEFVRVISKLREPLVAAVNGPAVGVGATLLLHCDLVVAAREAYFAMPFVDLGLCAEAGSSYLLPRLLGQRKAAELLLLGERIDAERALTLGLVNRVCDADNYQTAAMELAEALAAKPRQALLATKALMQQGQQKWLAQQIEGEFAEFARLLGSDAAQELISLTLNK